MTQKENPDSIGLLPGGETEEKPRKEPVTEKIEPPREPQVPAGEIELLPADVTEASVAAGSQSAISVLARTSGSDKDSIVVSVDWAATSSNPGGGAEWRAWIRTSPRKKDELFTKTAQFKVKLEPGVPASLLLEVEAPVGVRYRDRVDLTLTASWTPRGPAVSTLKLSWVTRQALLAIKTFRGYEREVADSLTSKAEDSPGTIFSLMVPSAMRGYVFVEGMSFDGVSDMLKGIRKARGLVKGETSLKEVEPLLEPKVTVEGFVEGAIVELVSGPFKGEKARVKRIDQEKEQITVELIEAVVPIPVTVRGDNVRMVEKGGS